MDLVLKNEAVWLLSIFWGGISLGLFGLLLFVRPLTRFGKQYLQDQEIKALYPIIVKQNAELIFVTDYEGNFTFICPNVVTCLGWSLSELYGLKNIRSLWIGQDYFLSDFGRQSKLTDRIEIQVRDKEGNLRLLSMLLTKTDLHGGRIIYNCRDLTDYHSIEQELRESEQQLRNIVTYVSDGLLIVSQSGHILFTNPAAARLFGRSPEELQHTWFGFPLGEQSRHTEISLHNTHNSHKKLVHCEMRVTSLTWQGQIAYLVSLRDVSDRKKLETEREFVFNQLLKLNQDLEDRVKLRTQELEDINQRLRQEITERQEVEIQQTRLIQRDQALIQAMGDIVYERFIDSGTMFWQGEYAQLLGYNEAQMGQNSQLWLDHIYPDDQVMVLTKLEQAFQSHGLYDLEYRFQHKDGSYIWIHDRGVMIGEDKGRPQRIIGIMRNISDRKQNELQIQQALIHEKELNQIKTRFMDIASHEFRTPLTSIIGFSDLLSQYSHKLSSETQQKHLHHIVTAAQRLQELIEDVLKISRAESGKLSPILAPVNLHRFCNDLVETLAIASKNSNPIYYHIQYQNPEQPTSPLLDETLIQHIFSNILSNALKYSKPGSPIEFQINCHPDQLIIFIKDQGIGIPCNDLIHLFEPFHRAQNVGKIPGTGLGLHIVKKYVELHNGTIIVSSEINIGTIFRVTLPCQFLEETND